MLAIARCLVLGGFISVVGCTVAAEEPQSSSEQAIPVDGTDPLSPVGLTCPSVHPTCSRTPGSFGTNAFEVALKQMGCTRRADYRHRSDSVYTTRVAVCPNTPRLAQVLSGTNGFADARAVSNVCDRCLPAAEDGWIYVLYFTRSAIPHCTGGCSMEPVPY